MTIQEQIKQRIDEVEPGTVVFVNDFAEFDNEYVSKLLSTLKDFGVLERLAKGIYYKPIVSQYSNVYPSTEKIVKLILISKDIKERGDLKELLAEIKKKMVLQEKANGKVKLEGVGQLVKNALFIQTGTHYADKDAPKDSVIYPILAVTDRRLLLPRMKNYLDYRMYEECMRQSVDSSKIMPLLLIDIATLNLYSANFKKYGMKKYADMYYLHTNFPPNADEFYSNPGFVASNHFILFATYMRSQDYLGMDKFRDVMIESIIKSAKV